VALAAIAGILKTASHHCGNQTQQQSDQPVIANTDLNGLVVLQTAVFVVQNTNGMMRPNARVLLDSVTFLTDQLTYI